MPDNKQASRNPTQQAQKVILAGHSLKDFTGKVVKFENQFSRLIPDSLKRSGTLTAERVIGQLANLYSVNEDIQNCRMASILNSAAMACSVGLEFNNAFGHSAIIPYKQEATWQPMYRGLITLASRAGRVHDVKAKVVMAQDDFEWEEGEERLTHRPASRFENQEFNLLRDWRYVYSRIRWKDAPGMPSFYVLDRHEVERVKAVSSKAQSDKSPWNTHPEEMIQKTPVKRQLKNIDLSSHTSLAAGWDDQAEADNVKQDIVLDWKDYRTAEEMDEPKKGYVPGTDPQPVPPQTQQSQPTPQPQSDPQTQTQQTPPTDGMPKPGGVTNDTAGPFTEDMFSVEEFEWLVAQSRKLGKFRTAGQLAGYIGNYEKTKGELLEEFKDK
jgi:phage RecT family recombinase